MAVESMVKRPSRSGRFWMSNFSSYSGGQAQSTWDDEGEDTIAVDSWKRRESGLGGKRAAASAPGGSPIECNSVTARRRVSAMR